MRTRRPVLTLLALAALLLSWSGVVEASCMSAMPASAAPAADDAHAHHGTGMAGHGHGGHTPAPPPADDDGAPGLPLPADCPFALGSAGSCLGGFVTAAAPQHADDLAAALPFPAPVAVHDLLIASSLERPPNA